MTGFCTSAGERDLLDQELVASLVSIRTRNAVVIVDAYFADDEKCSAEDVECKLNSSDMLIMAASESVASSNASFTTCLIDAARVELNSMLGLGIEASLRPFALFDKASLIHHSRFPSVPSPHMSATTHLGPSFSIGPTANARNDPFVVFVGAGPVGLWTAVQFRLANPEAPVLMLEKYAHYRRTHVLRVEKESFDGAYDNSLLSTFIAQTPRVVRTDELEFNLQRLATTLGIEIRRGENVLSLSALQARYPSSAIVGADGAHSRIRKSTGFGELFASHEVLSYSPCLVQSPWCTDQIALH